MAFTDYQTEDDEYGVEVNLEQFLKDTAEALAPLVEGSVGRGRSDELVGVDINSAKKLGGAEVGDIFFFFREDDFKNPNPDDPNTYEEFTPLASMYITVPSTAPTNVVLQWMQKIDAIRDPEISYYANFYDEHDERQDGYPNKQEIVTAIDIEASWGTEIYTTEGEDVLNPEETANNIAWTFNQTLKGIEAYFGGTVFKALNKQK